MRQPFADTTKEFAEMGAELVAPAHHHADRAAAPGGKTKRGDVGPVVERGGGLGHPLARLGLDFRIAAERAADRGLR